MTITNRCVHRARRFAKISTAVVALLGATACTQTSTGPQAPVIEENTVGLAAFNDCPQLLNYFHEEAIFLLDNWDQVELDDIAVSGGVGRDGALGAPQDSNEGNAANDAAGPAYSDTNIQERGVDEPDIVKTDGQFIYVAQGGRLLIHQADDLTEISRSELGSHDGQIFLSGDQVIVVGRTSEALDEAFGEVQAEENRWKSRVSIEVFDVSDRAAPNRVRQTFVDGSLQTARLVNRTLRVVVFNMGGDALEVALQAPSGGPTTPPTISGGSTGSQGTGEPIEVEVEAEEQSEDNDEDAQFGTEESPLVVDENDGRAEERAAWLERARDAIRATSLDDWLPKRYDAIDAAHTVEPVTTCGQFHRPGERSGLGVVAIVSINLDTPADILRDSAVVTGPGVAYASGQSLYLTTGNRNVMIRQGRTVGVTVTSDGGDVPVSDTATGPIEPTDETAEDAPAMGQREDGLEADDIQATQVHRLDISGQTAQYVASGRVRGLPLNSFSLSEHEGHLRIATTEDRWRQDAERINHLFVLETEDRGEDGELSVTGHIGEIAEGERIYAARFMGDKGFLVTFRQIDPLFTLDLSDPAAPSIVGELKVPGFSTYLHPYGEEHLMGIGQAATDEGQITGMQLSLFDVSDFADPTLAHSRPLGHGQSDALYDHHAFTFWAPESLLMIPIISHDENGDRSGIEFFGVDTMTGFEERGFVGHDDLVENRWSRVQRALVIGDNVISVGQLGMKANALDTLDEQARVVFPEERRNGRDLIEPGEQPVPEPARPDDDDDNSDDGDQDTDLPPNAG